MAVVYPLPLAGVVPAWLVHWVKSSPHSTGRFTVWAETLSEAEAEAIGMLAPGEQMVRVEPADQDWTVT